VDEVADGVHARDGGDVLDGGDAPPGEQAPRASASTARTSSSKVVEAEDQDLVEAAVGRSTRAYVTTKVPGCVRMVDAGA
jgi:hypothetical protein